MNNKNIKPKSKLRLILIIVGLVLVVGTITSFVFQDKIKTVVNDTRVSIENQGKPKFTFDTAKFPDWATNGNVYVDTSDNKDDILVSSININQCDIGSNCNKLMEKCIPHKGSGEDCKQLEQKTVNAHCFVSAYYSKQAIDINTAKSDELKQWSGFGTAPTEIGVETLTMRTQEGDKNYELYQFDTNNKDATYRQGSAFGFISLNDGHIGIRSICWQADQLDETLPVLSATQLEV